QCTAGRREHHALDEQLSNDASTGGPDGRAYGDLPLAPSRTSEQEVGDIGAGDEQHKADCAGKYQKGETDITNERIPERLNCKAIARSHDVGEFAAELFGG